MKIGQAIAFTLLGVCLTLLVFLVFDLTTIECPGGKQSHSFTKLFTNVDTGEMQECDGCYVVIPHYKLSQSVIETMVHGNGGQYYMIQLQDGRFLDVKESPLDLLKKE